VSLEGTTCLHAGHLVEMQEKRKRSLRIYLLYLMGIMLFTDKSATYVDVTYLRYFRDLKLVSDNAWGAAALAHLYMELNNASHYKTRHLAGYLSLLQV